MNVEVQSKILNPMIKNTANNIRTISATLIPLVMLSGQQNGIMQYLSSFNLMSNDTAELIDHLELNKDHQRFDAAYVIPDYITKFLMNLERFLQSWDSANRLGGNFTPSPRGSKVVNMAPPMGPVPLDKNDIEEKNEDLKEYHLDKATKNSRLLPEKVIIELLTEYLDLYRIPESDYIDKLLAEYIPKIEEVYDDIHESFNIKRNIKALTLVVECLTKVSVEWQKHYDDDEWI